MLVIMLSFVSLISTIGYYTVADACVADFGNFTFNSYGQCADFQSAGPWCLGILLVMVMFLNVVSIMLYMHRMRQLRLTILSTLLLVGYVIAYAVFAYFYMGNIENIVSEGTVTYHMRLTTLFPVVAIIMNILAIGGIRKDEALVRSSYDRLR